MARKLISVVSYVVAVAIGAGGAAVFNSSRLNAALPSCLRGSDEYFRGKALAMTERFVLAVAEPNKTVCGDEKQYFLWDRIVNEILASFSEEASNGPLLTRNLYCPGPVPQPVVAWIDLDKLNSTLMRILLSPVASDKEHSVRERIFDDNGDGVCDRILEGVKSPYRALVRINEMQWTELRTIGDTAAQEIFNDGEWVPARQGEDGFWHASPQRTIPDSRVPCAVPGRVQNIDRPPLR